VCDRDHCDAGGNSAITKSGQPVCVIYSPIIKKAPIAPLLGSVGLGGSDGKVFLPYHIAQNIISHKYDI
jgi:hypothetical protein